MITYSRQLIQAARAVLADGYYDLLNMQPDDLAEFQRAIASRTSEANLFSVSDMSEFVNYLKSHNDNFQGDNFQGDNFQEGRESDYEWGGSGNRSFPQAFKEGEASELSEGNQNDESESADSEIDALVEKEREDKRRALEAINRVLNIYYPYKTLSAAVDFDRLRALFAEQVPDLAEDISDERLKMYLFAVGGTLIGRLRPREERLAEAKRRAANPDAYPRARSYEQDATSRYAPNSTSYDSASYDSASYDSYDKSNESEQEVESSINDVAESGEHSLDAQAEAITRAFNAPRPRSSQFSQNSSMRSPYGSQLDDSNDGYDVENRAPSQRYGISPNGYSSRYANNERSNFVDRAPRQGYGSAPYERPNYDRYGSERQGYDRSSYDRGGYAERSYDSERFNSSSRFRYGDREGNPRYNGGYSQDGFQNGRSYDSGANGYSDSGRSEGYSNSNYRNGYSNAGFVSNGYTTSRACGHNGLREFMNSRPRAINSSVDSNVGSAPYASENPTRSTFGRGLVNSSNPAVSSNLAASSNPVASSNPAESSTAIDPTNPPLTEVVRVTREILTNYFPYRQVRLGEEFARFRLLLGFKFPQAKFSDDKLRMFVPYAGGSILGAFRTVEAESLLGSDDSSTRSEAELKEAASQALSFFPGNVVDGVQEFEKFRVLFHARFDEGDVKLSDETLKKIIRAVGGILPGQEELKDVNEEVDVRFTALVEIAKKILETKFSRSVFKRDLSDFSRFRIQFESLAGPGAVVEDGELRDAFLAAGGVFEEEPKPQEKPVVKLIRSAMIKKVVAENFPNGLSKSSHDDLELFRKLAKEYDYDFDKETDAKLYAIVVRCCVPFDDKAFSVPEEGKEKIKKLVESLFNVGAHTIYYETYFEKNASWLTKYNVGCADFLKTLLAVYFPKFFFYDYYFEKTVCEDSERVKIMRDIERVWGGVADPMTPEEIAARLYAPVDRVRKALELGVEYYKAQGDAFVRVPDVDPSQKFGEDEELDDQFDAFFPSPEEQETEDVSDAEEIEDERDKWNKFFSESDSEEDEEDDVDEDDEEDEEDEATKESRVVPKKAKKNVSSELSLFDMLTKEAEEDNIQVDVPSKDKDADDEFEASQEELEAQRDALAELLRAYFPEGFDVESEDELASLKSNASKDGRDLVGSDAQIVEQIENGFVLSDGRYFAVADDAKTRVGELLDEWFDAGWKIVYYEIFWKKRRDELTSGGVFNEGVLIDVMKETRPNYRYYDSYLEATENDEPELIKVKEEILRFWTTDVARRVSDIETALYVSKATAGETFKHDSDFTPSSNGYWNKTKTVKSKSSKGTKGAKSASKASAPKKTATPKAAPKKDAAKKSASKKS